MSEDPSNQNVIIMGIVRHSHREGGDDLVCMNLNALNEVSALKLGRPVLVI